MSEEREYSSMLSDKVKVYKTIKRLHKGEEEEEDFEFNYKFQNELQHQEEKVQMKSSAQHKIFFFQHFRILYLLVLLYIFTLQSVK